LEERTKETLEILYREGTKLFKDPETLRKALSGEEKVEDEYEFDQKT